MEVAMTDGVLLARDGAVLTVTVDRPDRQNRIDPETCGLLRDVFEEADADHSVRAIVVTGTGDRHFCTGADLSADVRPVREPLLPPDESTDGNGPEVRPPLIDARSSVADFHALYRTYWELETPVVAAVNGTVAGAGLPLAFCADLVIASDQARFRSIWHEGGMSAHAGDPFFLPRIFPLHRLMEFAFSPRSFTADELLGWNVLNRVVPDTELMAEAHATADGLAAGPTLAMGQTKRLYRRSLEVDLATSFAEEAAAIVMLSPSADRKEGMRALTEGRRTSFTGR